MSLEKLIQLGKSITEYKIADSTLQTEIQENLTRTEKFNRAFKELQDHRFEILFAPVNAVLSASGFHSEVRMLNAYIPGLSHNPVIRIIISMERKTRMTVNLIGNTERLILDVKFGLLRLGSNELQEETCPSYSIKQLSEENALIDIFNLAASLLNNKDREVFAAFQDSFSK
jgi:hypothetical protein